MTFKNLQQQRICGGLEFPGGGEFPSGCIETLVTNTHWSRFHYQWSRQLMVALTLMIFWLHWLSRIEYE